MSGIINIIVGIAFVAAGLSGKFALLGTNSPKALAAVGLIPIAMGIYQLIRRSKRHRGE
jgi:cadmium resistance protein CadD (predicted permease)